MSKLAFLIDKISQSVFFVPHL